MPSASEKQAAELSVSKMRFYRYPGENQGAQKK